MKDLKERAEKIKWFIMDVDGVLTDGSIIYDSDGRELKKFSVKDGMGITLLHNVGIKTGIITSRKSFMVEKRAKELGISAIIQGAINKLLSYEDFKKKYSVNDEDILFIGDDLVDLPVLKRVGFPVAVSDAPEELKIIAIYITEKKGGDGAVRETAELILKLSGKYREAIEKYLG